MTSFKRTRRASNSAGVKRAVLCVNMPRISVSRPDVNSGNHAATRFISAMWSST